MINLRACRAADPAGTRYLRLAVDNYGQLRRLERGVISEPGGLARRSVAIADAADHQGDVRVGDPFGTRYSRREIGSESVARELKERQVSLSVGFALFARAALSQLTYASRYYLRDFAPVHGEGDLIDTAIGQRIIYRRLEPVELFRQVANTMQYEGGGLETASPLMWQYLDRYLLPQLPEVIPGSARLYKRISASPAALAADPRSREEAIAGLMAGVDVHEEFLQLYTPTGEQLSALLRDEEVTR